MWFRSARKSDRAKRRASPTVIGSGFTFEGDLKSDGELHIAGTVTGNVTARSLTLYKGSTVSGTAKAEKAIINGTLSGRLAAAEVVLGSKGQVMADITYVSLRIETGAVFVGQTRRVESLDAIPAELMKLPPPVITEARTREPTGLPAAP